MIPLLQQVFDSAQEHSDVLLIACALACRSPFPFFGIFARYRINYTPKDTSTNLPTQLSETSTLLAKPKPCPPSSSLWHITRNIVRTEGIWTGLYKGAVPAFFTSTNLVGVFYPAIRILTNGAVPPLSSVASEDADTDAVFLSLAVLFIVLVIDVPAQILANRAIVLPESLSVFSPCLSLSKLLTPYERRRPYALYTSHSSLVLIRALILATYTFFMPLSTRLLPAPQGPFDFDGIMLYAYENLLLFTFVFWVVVTPLEVLSARLAIQRAYDPSLFSKEEEEGEVTTTLKKELPIRVRGQGEDADLAPYSGLFHAIRTIGNEEGYWKVLYRLFWLMPIETLWMGFIGVA